MFRNAQTRSVAAAFVVLAGLLIGPSSSAAQPDLANPPGLSQANPGGDLRLLAETLGEQVHPQILQIADIDTSAFEPTLAELSNSQRELSANQDSRVGLVQKLTEQQASQQKLSREVEQALMELSEASLESAEAGAELETFAVSSFKRPAVPMWLDVVTTGEVNPELGMRRQIEGGLVEKRTSLRAAYGQKQEAADFLTGRLTEVSVEVQVTSGMLAEIERRISEAEKNIARLAPQLVNEVLLAPLFGLPFPVVVLHAYYRAQLFIAQSNPQCGVSWFQLAGIGKVETGHGTFGGRSVSYDGRTSAPILGPELNGDPFRAISDTDGGSLDNNPVWDHAVGPMQFIPSSWRRYGADGNGDSVSDPHNIYDAALAAAKHLCGSRSQLAASNNFTLALLGYNRSTSYGVAVQVNSNAYAQALALR